jgi:rubrerythrin
MEMTWEEILNRAIAKEEEAYSNYHAMAKRASNPGTQTMFNELAEEEGSSLAKGLEETETRCVAERLAAEERGHRTKLERLLEEEMFQEM